MAGNAAKRITRLFYANKQKTSQKREVLDSKKKVIW